ncbi:sulfur carrier protein ThiS adenylyltransferase ThiF [Desulfopila sp. IMCC35008]|uniref:sulfur carrier protein ThiS adenylyltransferase ThiF n=1 Tax=Desulfopila sp. IMCC35008 TaxID=2653858 RepID=UPI0013D15E08|nr:sulfur carrier protein ThiS adenylyltransferase ThiF [Desulfopila sp. IMCC35008]
MKIGIAGVGGIGSNVAVNLVRSGIRELTIVDYDRVELSNLNRQFYFADQIGLKKVDMLTVNLQRIVPDLQIQSHDLRLTIDNCEQLFHNCDTIVEGLDKSEDKKMVLEQFGTSKFIVSACGIGGSEIVPIATRHLGTSHIVGDFVTDCSQHQLYAHKVIAVAARMTELLLTHHSHE